MKQKANEIFGFGKWGYRVKDLVCIGEETFTNGNGKEGIRVGYRATVEVWARGTDLLNLTWSDTGYGDAQEYNGSRITPHELASKEAVTDGMKRAFTSLGDQFGLCLYDKEAPEHNGEKRDVVVELKKKVSQVALDGGAERSAEAIAEFYNMDAPALASLGEDGLRELLAFAAG